MQVTDSQPVSTGNLKAIFDNGVGGAVLYDDPDKRPQDKVNSDTVTLSKAAEGYRTLDVWLLTYNVFSGSVISFNSAFVSFPTNIKAVDSSPHPKIVGVIPKQASTMSVISVDQLSGTTLKINAASSAIVRVVGRN